MEDLVSHGYVVASIEHTYAAMAVVFPNGRVVPFHQEAGPMQVSAGLAITEGARDVVFVLSKLTELNGQNAHEFALGGRLAVNRVAAMGHSSGGALPRLHVRWMSISKPV